MQFYQGCELPPLRHGDTNRQLRLVIVELCANERLSEALGGGRRKVSRWCVYRSLLFSGSFKKKQTNKLRCLVLSLRCFDPGWQPLHSECRTFSCTRCSVFNGGRLARQRDAERHACRQNHANRQPSAKNGFHTVSVCGFYRFIQLILQYGSTCFITL